jgi:hypothetical protein
LPPRAALVPAVVIAMTKQATIMSIRGRVKQRTPAAHQIPVG